MDVETLSRYQNVFEVTKSLKKQRPSSGEFLVKEISQQTSLSCVHYLSPKRYLVQSNQYKVSEYKEYDIGQKES